MVKTLLLILSITFYTSLNSQNISLGVGGSLLLNQLGKNEDFKFDILDSNGDTLTIKAKSASMAAVYSLPIYIRYTSNKNWWMQLNYGFEYWRLNLNGKTQHSTSYINQKVNVALTNGWQNYQGSDFTDYQGYADKFTSVFLSHELKNSQQEFNSFDAIQYNKFSLAFGSSLFQKNQYKIIYGLGLDFITKSTSESYHGLIYDNSKIDKQFEILQALPALVEYNFSPMASIGFEKQNLRVGLDIHFFPSPANSFFEESNPDIISKNNVTSPTLKNLVSYGMHLNYNLFSHYLEKQVNKEKAKILDPEILGRYVEVPKLWRFGFTVNFINLYNIGWTSINDFELSNQEYTDINDGLKSNNDSYLIGSDINDSEVIDIFYLERRTDNLFINTNGSVDTNFISQILFFGWSDLNTIIKSPKLSGFVAFSPFKNYSFETNLGYQTQTMGIEVYEKEISTIQNSQTVKIRELLYQETYHQISLGLSVFGTKKITNTSKAGINLGLNYNVWIPGAFRTEKGGINDSELLVEFHDYFINGEHEEEWNKTINPEANKGIFSKKDYYNYQYNPDSPLYQSTSYHSDFSNQLFNTNRKRNFFDIRLGLDYYIEKWRFSLYGKRSLWKNNSFYNDLFTLGMSFTRFIN